MANFSPTNQPICLVRGDSPVIPVRVADDTDTAIDITGGTFVLTVDTLETPADAATNVFSVAGTITDAPNGRVSFQPTTTDTDQEIGDYFYDIQMTLNGSVRTILRGDFTIEQDITKV